MTLVESRWSLPRAGADELHFQEYREFCFRTLAKIEHMFREMAA